MNNKKNSKVMFILIGILVVLIVGMGIYIGNINTEMTNDKNTKVENKDDTENIEYLDIYSNDIQSLFDNVHVDENCNASTISFYIDGSVSIENFKSYAFYIAYQLLVEENGVVQSGGWKKLESFTYDEINKKAKTIFGNDFNVEDKEYVLCSYSYDSKNKTYSYGDTGGCGCTSGPDGPIINVYQATKTKDEINIYVSVVYGKYDEDLYYGYVYYKDPLYNKKISDFCSTNKLTSKECIDNSTKYKFTYQKENENYILTNITKEL